MEEGGGLIPVTAWNVSLLRKWMGKVKVNPLSQSLGLHGDKLADRARPGRNAVEPQLPGDHDVVLDALALPFPLGAALPRPPLGLERVLPRDGIDPAYVDLDHEGRRGVEAEPHRLLPVHGDEHAPVADYVLGEPRGVVLGLVDGEVAQVRGQGGGSAVLAVGHADCTPEGDGDLLGHHRGGEGTLHGEDIVV
ncbi:hypothetical protein VM1G_11608 [Cytospora mali]|uniref:Uncharacterized protein n=1 Tax=Cytospora mali TaxID=578113 RepID=A0A194VZR6_CYTMA|nr:hypothetical protein VM1G_11608 [Valsa mali]